MTYTMFYLWESRSDLKVTGSDDVTVSPGSVHEHFQPYLSALVLLLESFYIPPTRSNQVMERARADLSLLRKESTLTWFYNRPVIF